MPAGVSSGDVESLDHLALVEVRHWRGQGLLAHFGPWGVVGLGKRLLLLCVSHYRMSVNDLKLFVSAIERMQSQWTLFLKNASIRINGLKDIVHKNVRSDILKLIKIARAFLVQTGTVVDSDHGVVTRVLDHLVVKLSVVQSVPVSHVEHGWSSVVRPVGASVSDHDALQVDLSRVLVVKDGTARVILVDLIHHPWNVDPAI